MNYDYEKVLTDVVGDIKADKSIMQPWKNKAMARIDEARVFVAEGKRITNQKPPEDMPAGSTAPRFPVPTASQCICQRGMPPRKDCPIHGGNNGTN